MHGLWQWSSTWLFFCIDTRTKFWNGYPTVSLALQEVFMKIGASNILLGRKMILESIQRYVKSTWIEGKNPFPPIRPDETNVNKMIKP